MNNVTRDCIARELFDLLPQDQNSLEAFNSNLKSVRYYFYGVQDDRLSQDVLDQFIAFERNGVLDLYDKKYTRSLFDYGTSIKIEQARFLISLGKYQEAYDIIEKYSEGRTQERKEATKIEFLLDAEEYDKALQGLEDYFTAKYRGPMVIDGPEFGSQILRDLFLSFLERNDFKKAEYIISLIHQHSENDDFTMSSAGAYSKLIAKRLDLKQIDKQEACEDLKNAWLDKRISGSDINHLLIKYDCYKDDSEIVEIIRELAVKGQNLLWLAIANEDQRIRNIGSMISDPTQKFRWNLRVAEAYAFLGKMDVAFKYIADAKSLLSHIQASSSAKDGVRSPECLMKAMGMTLDYMSSEEEGARLVKDADCRFYIAESDLMYKKKFSLDHLMPFYEKALKYKIEDPAVLSYFIKPFVAHRKYDEVIILIDRYWSNDRNTLYKNRSDDALVALSGLMSFDPRPETDREIKRRLWNRYFKYCVSYNPRLGGKELYMNSRAYRKRQCYIDFLRKLR